MKNKKGLWISLFVCLLTLTTTIVYAAGGTGGDYTGGSETEYQGDGSTTFTMHGMVGIRISFVDVKGKILSEPINYYYDEGWKIADEYIITEGFNKSRLDYAKGSKVSFNEDKLEKIQDLTNAESLDELIDILTQNSLGFNEQTIRNAIINFNYEGIFDPLLPSYKNNASNSSYYADVKEILEDLSGITFDTTKNYNEMFMVFEPLVQAQIIGKYYFGTVYEIDYIAGQKEGGHIYNKNNEPLCKADGATALCDLQSALRKTAPCASYLEGTLYDQMKKYLAGTKYKSVLDYFEGNNYFGGIIKKVENAKTICTTDKSLFSEETVKNAENGIGMGIVWIGEMIQSGYSCEDAIEQLETRHSNWKDTLATIFDRSGVDEVKKEVDNWNISVNGSEIDNEWFVNECTCYGAYDYYTEKIATKYAKTFKSTINEINSELGKGWYVAGKLNEITSSSLQNKDLFIDFNTMNKTYADKKELTHVDMTAERYLEDLKCETKKSYWCEDFEEWYEDNAKSGYPSIEDIKNSGINTIQRNYQTQLETMIKAYNLTYYNLMDFMWNAGTENKTSGSTTEHSYILNCTINSMDPPSCYEVNDYVKIDSSKSCTSITDNLFTKYNKANGQSVTAEWYKANCGCTEAKVYNCTPQYDVGNCVTGIDVLYKDSGNGTTSDEYWDNCVFNDNGTYDIATHKVADKSSALTYYESSLSNRYCEVYCIENLSAAFTQSGTSVEAGSRFYLGSSTVSGGRTCKTKTVNWSKFSTDLVNANNSIHNAYVALQLEKAKVTAIGNKSSDSSTNNGCSCRYTSPHGVRCCTSDRLFSKQVCTETIDGTKNCSTIRYYQCTTSNYTKYTRYTATVSPFTVDGTTVSWGTSWCANQSAPSTSVYSKQIAYNTAISSAQGVVNDMTSCYTWNASNIYSVNPSAQLTYSDNKNYYYTGQLTANTSYSGVSSNASSSCDRTTVQQITSCSGNRCTSTAVSMLNCSENGVEMTRRGTTTFTLPSGVYTVVLKDTNTSIHANELGNYSNPNFTTNYYTLPASNLPVSFSAPNGVYGTMYGRGALDIVYNNLGHVKSTARTIVDTILGTIDRTNYGQWKCSYNVYSDLIPCDSDDGSCSGKAGDISVVYRQIDLADPFPDIDGSLRNTGSNWCDGTSCSYNNGTVKEYILNNRDVVGDEVYLEDPMYTFVLTPAIIKQIREYNNENSYTSYTGSLGTAKYMDFQCTPGLGGNCRSGFLDYLTELQLNVGGTCMNNVYRSNMTTNYSTFESCR